MTNLPSEFQQRNLHEMFAYDVYRGKRYQSLTRYKNHHILGGFDGTTLEEIIGSFEDAYEDEASKSLVSQLSRISASFQLYDRKNDNNLGIALAHPKKGKGKGKTHTKAAKEYLKDDDDSNECGCVGSNECVCDAGECECEGACDFCGGKNKEANF